MIAIIMLLAGQAWAATVAKPSSIGLAGTSSTAKFTVSIALSATPGATYVVQEATDALFTQNVVTYPAGGRYQSFTKADGTYFYKAKAVLAGWTDSAYTAARSIVVASQCAPPSAIGVSGSSVTGTYSISLGASTTVGVSYVVQEATDAAFTTGIITYPASTSRYQSVTGKTSGTFYYRAKAVKAGMADSIWTTGNATISVANSSTCAGCHTTLGTSLAASQHGNPNNTPGAPKSGCGECHAPTNGVNTAGASSLVCTNCHTAGTTTTGVASHTAQPVAGNVTVALCRTCHDSDHIGGGAEIGAKVAAGPHGAATGHLTGTCQRCHATEGSVVGATVGWTGSYGILSTFQATLWDPNAPATSTDGIACSACHDSHTGGMRAINTYDGTNPVAWDPNGNATVDQYDTCTGCHTLTDNTGAVVGNYHNGGAINYQRTISDSHNDLTTTGTTTSASENNAAIVRTVEGYVIRTKSANPCGDCHDVHAGNLAVQEAWAKSAHAGKSAIKKAAAVAAAPQGSTNPERLARIDASTNTGALDDADGNAWTHYNWDRSGRQGCQRCHTATGASNFLTSPTTYNAANNNFSHLSGWVDNADADGSPQNELLYCWGCHSDVASGALRNPGAITENYAAVVNTGSGTTGTPVTVTYSDLGPSNVCMGCHLGREVGANITNTTDGIGTNPGDVAGQLSFINSHYLTAGATIFGQSGYEYSGQTYSAGFHQNVGQGNAFSTGTAGPCVTCHMTGAEAHSFEVLNATGDPASPICAQCHTGLDATDLNTARSTFDTALHELALALESKGIYYYPAHPYFYTASYVVGGTNTAFTNWASIYGEPEWKNVMGAAFNYNLLHHDPGAYAHNRQYALDLIADSIDYIVDGTINGIGGTFLTEAVEVAEDGNHVAFAATDCTPCHTSGLPGPPVLPSNTSAHALTSVPTVSNVQFAVSDADLVLSYNLKFDGVNATGFTVVNRDYRYDGTDRSDLGTVTTAVDNGSGNYSVTLPGAAANGNNRYLLRVTNAAGIVRALVVGDYPASPVTSLAADSACTDCHGQQTEGFHYSYPVGQAQCVVCHDAANTTYPRFVTLGHSIHNSHNMASGHFELDAENVFSVTFPTYMNNCANCHRDSTALATVNAEPVSYNFCTTCHGDWDGWSNTVVGGTLSFHRTYTGATVCSGCHNGVAAPATVADMHNGLLTERSGLIWDGQDVSVVEGAKIDTQITEVSRAGNNLVVKWTATYDGNPVDPCFGPSTAGSPLPSWKNASSAFSVLRAWGEKDDWTNNDLSTSPGQPVSTNLGWPGTLSATVATTTCGSNVATTTVMLTAAELAEPAGTNLGIALQGKVGLYNANRDATDGTGTGVIGVRAKTPYKGVVFQAADGVLANYDRRNIIDTAACLKCHPGSLYQHGGNRIDNVDLCVMCHNEASTEQNVRLLDGVSTAEAYDQKPGQTYGFKSLLHAVHSAGHNEAITMCYRTNGNYVWSGHSTVIPNYPTADVFADDSAWGEQTVYWVNDDAAKTHEVGQGVATLVYGSSAPHGTGPQTAGTPAPPVFSSVSTNANFNPAYPAGTTYTAGTEYQVYRAHNLHQTTYPQVLNNCVSCHKPGTFGFPDAAKAVATTVDAGTVGLGGTAPAQTASNATNSNLADDIVQGPAAAACFSCHQGVMAPPVTHGNAGGFAPANFGERTSVPAETCAGCHTP